MRILLFEYLTGGGTWLDGDARPPAAWLVEGRAMIEALAADAVAAGHEVQALADRRAALRRLPRVEQIIVGSADRVYGALTEHGRAADWTLVIAPETGGRLARIVQHVSGHGGRCLNANGEVIALAADKHALAKHLNRFVI